MKKNFYKIKIKNFKKNSGSLITLQKIYSLIKVKNSFIIKSNKNKIRGNHAHKKATQIIYCLKGEAEVIIDGINKKKTFLINDKLSECIYVSKLNWVKIKFLKKSIILVLSTEKYSEKEYIRNFDEFIIYKKK